MKAYSLIISALLMASVEGVQLNKKCPGGGSDSSSSAIENVTRMVSDMKASADKKQRAEDLQDKMDKAAAKAKSDYAKAEEKRERQDAVDEMKKK